MKSLNIQNSHKLSKYFTSAKLPSAVNLFITLWPLLLITSGLKAKLLNSSVEVLLLYFWFQSDLLELSIVR